jgi:hypothetical protein
VGGLLFLPCRCSTSCPCVGARGAWKEEEERHRQVWGRQFCLILPRHRHFHPDPRHGAYRRTSDTRLICGLRCVGVI